MYKQGDKWIHRFLNGIRLKIIVMARLKFELTYYDVAVQYDSINAKGLSPQRLVTLTENQGINVNSVPIILANILSVVLYASLFLRS